MRNRISWLVAVGVVAMLSMTATASAGFSNPDFETGDLSGWKNGNFDDDRGAPRGGMALREREVRVYDADSRFHFPGFSFPMPRGTFSPAVQQSGPGKTSLHQVVRIPDRAKKLVMRIFWNNAAGVFVNSGNFAYRGGGPNQFFSVDLIKRGIHPFTTAPDKVVKPIYAPQAEASLPGSMRRGNRYRRGVLPGGSFSSSEGWFKVVTGVRDLRGQRLRLRLAEVDNLRYLSVGIDDIKFRK